jgi:hypothetical protein
LNLVWASSATVGPSPARRIVVVADGTATAEGPDDWPFNSPFDLYDPKYAAMEIAADEFESTWRRAHRAEDADL